MLRNSTGAEAQIELLVLFPRLKPRASTVVRTSGKGICTTTEAPSAAVRATPGCDSSAKRNRV